MCGCDLRIGRYDISVRASVEQRWLFLSNPRAGSKSVRELLNPHSDFRVNVAGDGRHPHAPARIAKQMMEVELGVDWSEFHVFTTIRNPWARMASFWTFGAINPSSIWARIRADLADDFEAFCVKFPGKIDLATFTEDRGQRLVNTIIPIELADELLPGLLQALRIPARPLPHANRSGLQDYRPLYTEAAHDAVAARFASDIAYGGYSFDRLTARRGDSRNEKAGGIAPAGL